jgi:hypothetical protein
MQEDENVKKREAIGEAKCATSELLNDLRSCKGNLFFFH